jgi:hypothetical protein
VKSDPDIQAFFKRYERASAANDAETLAGLFAPSFLSAGPAGAQIVQTHDLVEAIPKRRQMLESVGCRPPALVSVQSTALDVRYSLVRTEWRWRVVHAGQAPADFTLPSTFIVEQSRGVLRIVCYLPHQDIMAVLRERGLMPSA